jgi:type II secretory pathway predicted ATPase ExeA
MYYKHFGLEGPPFRFSPLATQLFLSSAHRECLAALEWALLHDECGFMLLLGETGTGKTTLLNAICSRRIPRLQLACVTNPRLSFEEIMRVVLPQLGMPTDERGKLELIRQFEQVVSNRLQGRRTAIVIDEAQDLSDETLEDLRLLANRIGPQEQELQIVLVGHPELLDRLSARHLRQFLERISTRVSLLPLSTDESVAYVESRLAAQGGSARIFKANALRRLVEAAGGIPRRLNVLCHNALVLAYSKDANVVTADIAAEVINDYRAIFRPSPAAPRSVRKAQIPVESRDQHMVVPLEENAAVVPRRISIYAASACAAVAIVGAGSLLLPTAQTWSDQINHAVPAIAGVVAPAHNAAPPASYADNRVVAPTTETTAIADPPSTPIAAKKPAPAPGRTAIHIRAGDTFHDLAAKYLGSKDRAWDLIKANPQIDDPNVLYVGETIYLPSNRKNNQARLVQ